MELEDDLDKIRSTGDFKESSLPILVSALRQGEVLFSDEEKRNIMSSPNTSWTVLYYCLITHHDESICIQLYNVMYFSLYCQTCVG